MAINSLNTASRSGVFYYFHEIQSCREVKNGLELFSKGENLPVLQAALGDQGFFALNIISIAIVLFKHLFLITYTIL